MKGQLGKVSYGKLRKVNEGKQVIKRCWKGREEGVKGMGTGKVR